MRIPRQRQNGHGRYAVLTHAEIAERLNISKCRVEQLEKAAINKLRNNPQYQMLIQKCLRPGGDDGTL